FFFIDPATTQISPLSLHDALPICDALQRLPRTIEIALAVQIGRVAGRPSLGAADVETGRIDAHLVHQQEAEVAAGLHRHEVGRRDRKSTRLNSSHVAISYAVFCLK